MKTSVAISMSSTDADHDRQGEGDVVLGSNRAADFTLGARKGLSRMKHLTGNLSVSGSSEIACGKMKGGKVRKSSYRNWHLHCLRSRAGVAENVSVCEN